jgi:hypothetical protein
LAFAAFARMILAAGPNAWPVTAEGVPLMLSMILAIALQATAEPAPQPGASPATPPAAVTTVAPASAEAPIVYGVVEGRNAPKAERVCFNDPVLGSKIPTKRCISREDFQRRQQDAKDHLIAIQHDARAPVGN